MQALRTILIILLIYFTIRIFNRYIIPFFRAGNNNDENTKAQEKERIIRPEKGKKQYHENDGEYVDYEEVKD